MTLIVDYRAGVQTYPHTGNSGAYEARNCSNYFRLAALQQLRTSYASYVFAITSRNYVSVECDSQLRCVRCRVRLPGNRGTLSVALGEEQAAAAVCCSVSMSTPVCHHSQHTPFFSSISHVSREGSDPLLSLEQVSIGGYSSLPPITVLPDFLGKFTP